MDVLIGREEEKQELKDLLKSKKAELLAVFGRRRVGKIYLIQNYLKEHIIFRLTGTFRAPLKEQLIQFSESMQISIGSSSPLRTPGNWIDAFSELRDFIVPRLKNKKLVLFLDEFP